MGGRVVERSPQVGHVVEWPGLVVPSRDRGGRTTGALTGSSGALPTPLVTGWAGGPEKDPVGHYVYTGLV
jgi:hypothetical protein